MTAGLPKRVGSPTRCAYGEVKKGVARGEGMKRRLTSFLCLALAAALLYWGLGKGGLDNLFARVKTQVHRNYLQRTGDYDIITLHGIPVYVSNTLPEVEKAAINEALKKAEHAFSACELVGINMIVFAPSHELPPYVEEEGIYRHGRDEMTEGVYVPSLQEIYIFADNVRKDRTLGTKRAYLYVTIHELSHHVDLNILGREKDDKAEMRADRLALKKIEKVEKGYNWRQLLN